VSTAPRRHLLALVLPPATVAGAVVAVGADRTSAALAAGCLAVFVLFAFRHLAFAVAALRWGDDDLRLRTPLPTGDPPSVSVLVACHDEEGVADALAAALLRIDHPLDRLEIILVDDGSTDATGAILDRWATAHPRLQVLHRPAGAGGGKSGALNTAAALATGEIIVVFDADHLPSPDAVTRLVRHFADPKVGLAQGQCLIANVNDSRLSRTIALDYLAGYLVNEYGRQAVFELPAYGGANCSVRADVLRELGGWNEDSVTEDTDLTLRALLAGYRTRFDPTAQDFETAVVRTSSFWRQRYRWARGHQQVWRDVRRAVVRSPHLDPVEKVETLMFLLVYHVPAVCLLGLVLLALRVIGIGDEGVSSAILAVFLFAGPLLELGGGLVLARAPARAVWALAWFLPMFLLGMVVCTRALVDGLLGRPYSWVKTVRHGAVAT
jgi:cellulose synthase/poly-beta-1,6-N-acetylglucosamine synthase-like glycosyltransferase